MKKTLYAFLAVALVALLSGQTLWPAIRDSNLDALCLKVQNHHRAGTPLPREGEPHNDGEAAPSATQLCCHLLDAVPQFQRFSQPEYSLPVVTCFAEMTMTASDPKVPYFPVQTTPD